MRLLLVLVAVLLTGSVDSLWNNRPASVAQAVTYVGKAKTGGGSAEGESPEGIGKGESGEGDTLKVMRSVGANEGEDSRGSTAEEGSTGGSSGKAHEIRDAGEPGVVPKVAFRLEVVKDGTVAEEMDV
ncbi:unnamed protein product [Closterium sp. Naga37s-1]|nr:unnamed protein product [Closterium sp. Naga37s-1]